MAENIVSPGVFTRENDLSFLPQGIGAIGAAVLGPTVKGPAFVPTVIRRGFKEFEQYFGGLDQKTYVPQTVKEYLKNAGTVTVVRVLAGGGQNLDPSSTGIIGLAVSGSTGNVMLTSFMPSLNDSDIGLMESTLETKATNVIGSSFNLTFSGSNFVPGKAYSASLSPTAADYIEKSVGMNAENSQTGVDTYIDNAHVYTNFKNLQTSIAAASTAESFTITFGTSATDIMLTSSFHDANSTQSGSIFFFTADGIGHTLQFNDLVPTTLAAGNYTQTTATAGNTGSATVLNIIGGIGTAGVHDTKITSSVAAASAAIAINGITGVTASVTDHVVTVTCDEAGNTVLATSTFASSNTASIALTTDGTDAAGYGGLNASREIILVSQSTAWTYSSSYAEGYDHAVTPWVTSQFQSGVVKNLFKFHTLADGTSTNTEYKISIAGLKEIDDIDGEEQYSTFNVLVRKYGDKDSRPVVLEQFNNVNLDPHSSQFISRVIGDRYAAYDSTFGKVLTYGDYPNLSKLIRVEVTDDVKNRAYSPKLSPKGYRGVINPVNAAAFTPTVTYPSASYKTEQTISGNYNAKAYLGWKFDDEETDNKNFLKPLPYTNQETNVSGDFNVENYSVHPSASQTWLGSLSASLDTTGTTGPKNTNLQFSIPFQGGYDGNPTSLIKRTGEYMLGTNMQGMDLSSTQAVGYSGYKKAIDIMSNQDEYDINMLVLPGVIKQIHSSVTDAATTMAEDRGDTFYVMDLNKLNATVSTAANEAASLDSNYAAVYYPWVKVLDTSVNRPVFVPPSVVVPGAIAASDNISAEWFAPAGLNRGVLGNVLEAKLRLTQTERDELYEGKVNPIATFPRTGVCIWGQKTLQTKPTALDRINVRRLLIAVKKFIASSSKYLVFEQNTVQTRNRFLNIVNPYLESVQQRQGLFAFRVIMDESNNTPDIIDRNILKGEIFIQPAKTAEFIVLDFNVLPTGAAFPE